MIDLIIGEWYLIGKSEKPLELGCIITDSYKGKSFTFKINTGKTICFDVYQLNIIGIQKYEEPEKQEFKSAVRPVVGKKYKHPDLNFNLTCKISDLVSLFETEKENIQIQISFEDYHKLIPIESEFKIIELRNEKAWFGAEKSYLYIHPHNFLENIINKICSGLKNDKESVSDDWDKKYRLEIDVARIVEEN